MCKELQLPGSDYNYTADLVAVTSATPLHMASVQSISVLAVSAEGTARLWPSLAQEGNYTETDVGLGDLCNFVVAVRVSKCDAAARSAPGGPTWRAGLCISDSSLLLRAEPSSCPRRRTGCCARVQIRLGSFSTDL